MAIARRFYDAVGHQTASLGAQNPGGITDASGLVNITSNPANDRHPAWSLR